MGKVEILLLDFHFSTAEPGTPGTARESYDRTVAPTKTREIMEIARMLAEYGNAWRRLCAVSLRRARFGLRCFLFPIFLWRAGLE